MRRSGLQREILALYREFLRVAKAVGGDSAGVQGLQNRIRQEFRREAQALSPKEHERIEYRVRTARKKLKVLKSPGFSGVTTL